MKCEKDVKKERTKTRKIAQGICESTNIPSVIRFFQKSKKPEYKAGQVVQLKLNKDLFQAFFDLNKNSKKTIENN